MNLENNYALFIIDTSDLKETDEISITMSKLYRKLRQCRSEIIRGDFKNHIFRVLVSLDKTKTNPRRQELFDNYFKEDNTLLYYKHPEEAILAFELL